MMGKCYVLELLSAYKKELSGNSLVLVRLFVTSSFCIPLAWLPFSHRGLPDLMGFKETTSNCKRQVHKWQIGCLLSKQKLKFLLYQKRK
jgi:hypothetical protein